MPVYNGEKYIRGAIESILLQTHSNFELIISDNASTDGTQKICVEYAMRDSRIRYLRQPQNIGPFPNFSFILGQAKSEFFMWAAVDDRRPPHAVECLLTLLRHDPGCSLAFSDMMTHNMESGEESICYIVPSNSGSARANYLIRLINMCPSMIYGLFRTEKLKQVRLEIFDFFDVHLTLTLASSCRIRVANDILYIAGIKGERTPYSLTGKKIDRHTFLKHQFSLIFNSFGVISGSAIFLVACISMAVNKIKLRKYGLGVKIKTSISI